MISGWDNFFVAEVGASAALTGLLFVAISINLFRILEYKHLPARAADALVVLVSVLLVSSCGLVPGQSVRAFGAEVALIAGAQWLWLTSSFARHHRAYGKSYFGFRIVSTQLPPLPFAAGAAFMLSGQTRGVYWLAAGTVIAFAVGVLVAWVLLIEIQR